MLVPCNVCVSIRIGKHLKFHPVLTDANGKTAIDLNGAGPGLWLA